jgi:hypothetical protein
MERLLLGLKDEKDLARRQEAVFRKLKLVEA